MEKLGFLKKQLEYLKIWLDVYEDRYRRLTKRDYKKKIPHYGMVMPKDTAAACHAVLFYNSRCWHKSHEIEDIENCEGR